MPTLHIDGKKRLNIITMVSGLRTFDSLNSSPVNVVDEFHSQVNRR